MSSSYYDPTTGQLISDNNTHLDNDCNKQHNSYYDPTTGKQTTDKIVNVDLRYIVNVDNNCNSNEDDCCDNYSDTCSDNNSSNINCIDPLANNTLSLLREDLYSSETNRQCVTMAVLFNYNDNKNISNYGNINLPEIKIDYHVLTKVFFNSMGKGFNSNFLNRLWKSLTNFSLANKVLSHYERTTGLDRSSIPALNKVKLYKECAIDKISAVASKSFGLNLQEFNCALGSVDLRDDCTICSTVVIHLFFDSVNVGLVIVLKFSIHNTPKHLIGKISTVDETVDTVFDFTTPINNCNPSAEIVLHNSFHNSFHNYL